MLRQHSSMYNTNSFRPQRHQPVSLRTSDCDSFTCFGANESDNRFNKELKQNNPKTEGLHVLATIFLFQMDSSQVFCSTSVIAGSIRWCQQPNQVSQVVQLPHNDSSTCMVTRFPVFIQHKRRHQESSPLHQFFNPLPTSVSLALCLLCL